jgi:hypothetical protein
MSSQNVLNGAQRLETTVTDSQPVITTEAYLDDKWSRPEIGNL